jgi:hypothetical protein
MLIVTINARPLEGKHPYINLNYRSVNAPLMTTGQSIICAPRTALMFRSLLRPRLKPLRHGPGAMAHRFRIGLPMGGSHCPGKALGWLGAQASGMHNMKRTIGFGLAAAGFLASVHSADAHFVDGYIALCGAVGTGTCTELSASGYARQPVYFTAPVKGVSPLGNPVSFQIAATIAGRAIYDAPTGGNLIMVMPVAATITSPGVNYDVGAIKLTFTALAPYQFGETYIGKVAATTAMGTTSDGTTLTSGVALDFFRGEVLPQGFTL